MDYMDSLAHKIKQIIKLLEDRSGPSFFSNVADDVSWTIYGTEPPVAGHRSSKAKINKPFKSFGALVEPPGLKSQIRHLLVSENNAVAEFTVYGKATTGLDYSSDSFWIVRNCGDQSIHGWSKHEVLDASIYKFER